MPRSLASGQGKLPGVLRQATPPGEEEKGGPQRRKMMKLPAILILAFALMMPSSGARAGASGIEITEVKNVGISAANEARSIIQVNWTVKLSPDTAVKSFDVNVEIIYADGGLEKARASVSGQSRNARIEVPTLHKAAGRLAAEMKSFKAIVTAAMSETATRQGSF